MQIIISLNSPSIIILCHFISIFGLLFIRFLTIFGILRLILNMYELILLIRFFLIAASGLLLFALPRQYHSCLIFRSQRIHFIIDGKLLYIVVILGILLYFDKLFFKNHFTAHHIWRFRTIDLPGLLHPAAQILDSIGLQCAVHFHFLQILELGLVRFWVVRVPIQMISLGLSPRLPPSTRSSCISTTALFVFEFLHHIFIITSPSSSTWSLSGWFRQLKLKIILLNCFVALGLRNCIPLRTTNTSRAFLRRCLYLRLLIKLLYIALPTDILWLLL